MRGQFSLTTINTTIFMATLQLNLDSPVRQIPYFIGDDLWRDLVEFLRANFERHSVFVLSDDNIARHYRDRASEVLDSLSHFRGMITFPAGEASKSREMKAGLEDQLLGQAAGRDSVIIAMGGGVTGDLVGYLAATLHRGVPLIQLPTSLLAMVDSSVGGKVGINHPVGKNLLGAFYHPAATFVDLRFLATLPDEDFRSGMAEVIKYGTTLDDEFWLYLEKNVDAILRREPDALAHIVRTSI
nr:3-dehydroquinate synthase family protein [Calditrichia bacterium]